MLLYHRTEHGGAILADGFRDAEGYYMTAHLFRGVWVADWPLDCNEGAKGDDLLVADVPECLVAEFEWIEDGKGYREFLVPAAILNQYIWRLVDTDEEEESSAKRWR